MELNININLSDEDIRDGLTAQDVVSMLFPAASELTLEDLAAMAGPDQVSEPEVEVQEDEAEQEAQEDADIAKYEATVQPPAPSINNEQQEEVNEEPAPGSLPPRDDDYSTCELDSAGVPWDSEIHSSGKSQYKTGPEQGRWVWKRGSNPEERERIAQVLKEEVERSRPKSEEPVNNAGPVAVPTGPTVPTPRPENTQPAPGPVVPRPENSGAASTETVAPAPTGGVLAAPVSWKDLLNALDEHDIDATATHNALQAIEVDQIALLADDDNQEKRDALARELGLL